MGAQRVQKELGLVATADDPAGGVGRNEEIPPFFKNSKGHHGLGCRTTVTLISNNMPACQ